MGAPRRVSPEHVLASVYGRTSLDAGVSEKRRDELIAAAIYASFRNQEFGTRLSFSADYREPDLRRDAEGIDIELRDANGRMKRLQIKGIYLQRAIERRRSHCTGGAPAIRGRRARHVMLRDSEELSRIMQAEISKIIQDYEGLILVIHVLADYATQTSLEIAIRNSQNRVQHLKAREVWFIRQVPVRLIHGSTAYFRSYAYQLLKAAPDRHTYGYCFTL